MGSGPETNLVGRIVDRFYREHPRGWILKVHGSPEQRKGVPDLIGCVEGAFFALEVKARRSGETVEHARGRESVKQREQRRRLDLAGASVAVVLSVDEAMIVVRSALDARDALRYSID